MRLIIDQKAAQKHRGVTKHRLFRSNAAHQEKIEAMRHIPLGGPKEGSPWGGSRAASSFSFFFFTAETPKPP